MRPRLAALFLLALLVSSGARSALAEGPSGGTGALLRQEPVTLQEYQARVEDALRLLAAEEPAQAEDRLAAAEAALRGVDSVRLPDGSVAQLDFLLPMGITPDEALGRLQTVQRQMAASVSDDTDARLASLQDVLAGPEFRGAGWLERLNRWLAQLFGATANAALGGTAITWLIGVAGGLLAAVLLGYWLSGFFRSFVEEAELARAPAGEGMPLTAQAARARAAALRQAGDYREAVRLLYLSLLLQLEERGLLRGDRTLTNWEIVRELRTAAPGLGDGLQPVARTFDAVWYGMQQPEAAAFASYEQDVARAGSLIETVESPTRATGSTYAGAPEGEDRG